MAAPDFEVMRKVLLRQGIPDRVPFYEHIFDVEVIESVLGRRISLIDRSTLEGKRNYYREFINFFADMGYDFIPLEIPFDFPRENMLKGDDTAGTTREKREWADENSGPIQTRKDFESYPWPKMEKCADFQELEIAGELLPKGMKIIGGIAGGILEQVSWLMGLVPLSMALHDDPGLIEEMFNKTGSYRIYADEKIVKYPFMGSMRMGDDMGFKTSTMLAPNVLRKYVFPWQKKVVEIAHKNNLPFILHSCGQLSEIMDDLIDDVKIDAKHSYEDVILPVTEAKKIYGKRIAILGGLDIDFLTRRSEDEIRKKTREILEQCSPGGGYGFGSGNSITNYIPAKNYLAMMDEAKKFNNKK